MDYSDLYFDYYSLEPAVRQAEMERQGARLQEAWMLCAFPAVRDTKPPASRSVNVGLGQGPAFRVFRDTKSRASWSLNVALGMSYIEEIRKEMRQENLTTSHCIRGWATKTENGLVSERISCYETLFYT